MTLGDTHKCWECLCRANVIRDPSTNCWSFLDTLPDTLSPVKVFIFLIYFFIDVHIQLSPFFPLLLSPALSNPCSQRQTLTHSRVHGSFVHVPPLSPLFAHPAPLWSLPIISKSLVIFCSFVSLLIRFHL